MLDRKFIVENAEAVAKNCELRGVTADVARLVELEGQRRELLQQAEELNRRANEVSKSIGQAGSDEERPRLVRTILPDKLTGYATAQAICASLFQKLKSGKGCLLYTSPSPRDS